MKNPLIAFKQRIKETEQVFVLVESGYKAATKLQYKTFDDSKLNNKLLKSLQDILHKQNVPKELKRFLNKIKSYNIASKRVYKLQYKRVKFEKKKIVDTPSYELLIEQAYIWLCSYLEVYLFELCKYYINKSHHYLSRVEKKEIHFKFLSSSSITKKEIVDELFNQIINKDIFDNKKEVDKLYNNLFGIEIKDMWDKVEPLFVIRNILLHNNKEVNEYCAAVLNLSNGVGRRLKLTISTYRRRKNNALEFANTIYSRMQNVT